MYTLLNKVIRFCICKLKLNSNNEIFFAFFGYPVIKTVKNIIKLQRDDKQKFRWVFKLNDYSRNSYLICLEVPS